MQLAPLPARPQPTEAQKRAGNYAKTHIRFAGLPITIENDAGSVREGVDKNGVPWRTVMAYPYGYIKRTIGHDGDHVDVFVGPNEEARYVYVVHQVDPETGRYDEDKAMLGFDCEEDAVEAYRRHYSRPDDFIGDVTAVPLEMFKASVRDRETPDVVPGAKAAVNRAAVARAPVAVEPTQWLGDGVAKAADPHLPQLAMIKAINPDHAALEAIFHELKQAGHDPRDPQTVAIAFSKLRARKARANKASGAKGRGTIHKSLHTPPEAVVSAAKRALDRRAEAPDSQKGGTDVGLATARLLASGAAISIEKVRHIAAYFPRHEGDKQGATWDDKGPGWQAWHLWGGDAGWAWARKIVEDAEGKDGVEKSMGLRLAPIVLRRD